MIVGSGVLAKFISHRFTVWEVEQLNDLEGFPEGGRVVKKLLQISRSHAFLTCSAACTLVHLYRSLQLGFVAWSLVDHFRTCLLVSLFHHEFQFALRIGR